MPSNYPDTQAVQVYLNCPEIQRPQLHEINVELEAMATSLIGEVSCLQLYQLAHNLLENYQASNVSIEQREQTPVSLPVEPVRPIALGRRSIYFHHIIASSKRKIVKELADQLDLGIVF